MRIHGARIQKPRIIFVVGGPGSGKGTQCAKIKEKYGCMHYSTGDLLREQVATGSAMGMEIKKIQDAGGLVGSDLLVNLVKTNIQHTKGVYLLDGFPVNQENVDSWNKIMKEVCDTEFVLFFDCDIEKMAGRISEANSEDPETIKKRL